MAYPHSHCYRIRNMKPCLCSLHCRLAGIQPIVANCCCFRPSLIALLLFYSIQLTWWRQRATQGINSVFSTGPCSIFKNLQFQILSSLSSSPPRYCTVWYLEWRTQIGYWRSHLLVCQLISVTGQGVCTTQQRWEMRTLKISRTV